jgi:RNA polymerase sigma-32 factor
MTFSSSELAYLSGVATRSQLLRREQELELARRFRDFQDQRAADQLVRCHMVCEETPEDSYLRDERRAVAVSVVSSALKVLDKRESYIARHRLMADSEMSLAEIARSLRISRERARQLESRAKQKLARCLAFNQNRAVRELFVTVREP